jgi:hypothetical protein
LHYSENTLNYNKIYISFKTTTQPLMSQATVEEILAAAQQLPIKERRRLSDLLQREAPPNNEFGSTPKSPSKAVEDGSNGQSVYNREAEMQWLLDHPDFWEQHRGEHVALSGYQMIAVGQTRREVISAARRQGIQFPFVQYLPKNENEWFLGFSNQPVV